MALSLKHKFLSRALFSLDNWNAEHTISAAAGTILGRDTSEDGAVQELPIAIDTSGNMALPAELTVAGQASFTNATAPIIAAKIGPSSTQQHTLPAVASDTVALLSATQTFSNKTFSAPTFTGGMSLSGGLTVSAGGASITGNSSVTGTFLSSSTLTVSAGGIVVSAGGANITGSITTASWAGGVIAGEYGGTGVANTGKTITLGGDLTTSGAFSTTLTVTAATAVTLPTTGTLATLAGSETLTNKTLTSPTVSGGTINNASIGATTRSSGAFTTLDANGDVTLGDASTDTVTINGTLQPGMVISGSSVGDALRITQTGAGNALLVEDSASTDTSPFVIDGSGRVGIGTTSLSGYALRVARASDAAAYTTIGATTTDTADASSSYRFYSVTQTASNSGTPYTIATLAHYYAVQGTFHADSTVTEQRGFYAASSLVSGVTNYGFQSLLPVASTLTVSNVDRTSNVVTVTTSAAHGLKDGASVFVQATTNTSINGTFTVASVPSTTTFTYAQTGTDIASGADTGSVYPRTRWNAYFNGGGDNWFLGKVRIGNTSAGAQNLDVNAGLIVSGSTAQYHNAALLRYNTGATGPSLYLGISRTATQGANAAVSSGDALGIIDFRGNDGTGFQQTATVTGAADAAASAGSTAGRLVLSTTASGATSATERVRIASSGLVTIDSQAHSGAALSTTAPAKLYTSTGTYTDTATAASGTVTHGTIVAFDNPAINSTNASVTYTSASTVYIDGAPTGTGNVTVTNGYALFVAAGASRFGGSVLSTSATAGMGYATGAGGAQTQGTNRTTGVTVNAICGAITLVSAAGSTSWQTFTVTNSAVAATDTIIVNQKSGTDKYMIHVTNVGAGSFAITFATTGGTTTEQPTFNFAVLKAVAA